MKKIICLLLIACMIPVIASADMFTNMPYSELIKLHRELVQEIMSRSEWKEVEVPGGTWIVGEDIPAGTYSIHPTSRGGFINIYTDKEKLIIYQGIRKETQTIGKIELLEGYRVEISDGSLIFAPPVLLGF